MIDLQGAEDRGRTLGALGIHAADGVRLGVVGRPAEASVGPGGAIRLDRVGATVRWWVSSEERWHEPTGEASVRQRLVDGMPVVETVIRVPGGDIVATASGVTAPGGRCDVALEVENRTAVPVGIAFVIESVGSVGGTAAQATRSVAAVTAHAEGVDADGVPLVRWSMSARRFAGAEDRPSLWRAAETERLVAVAPAPAAAVLALVAVPHTAVVRARLFASGLADGAASELPARGGGARGRGGRCAANVRPRRLRRSA